MTAYRVLGMMSGTSLDGLDLALVEFHLDANSTSFELIKAATIPYENSLRKKLAKAIELGGIELIELDHYFAEVLARLSADFLKTCNKKPDLIVSHGHTVFHQPERSITLQIGHGPTLFSRLDYPLVYDLRSLDVSLGGQGAPLVPGAEFDLFPKYQCFLNIGGFSNISFKRGDEIKAFDICPVNTILNTLAQRMGIEYDKNGELARSGQIDHKLLDKLNNLEYYQGDQPKSLGVEWSEKHIWPLLREYEAHTALSTYTHHAAYQIGKKLEQVGLACMASGGGCYNTFLIELINKEFPVHVAEDSTVEFKEAICFAYLGLLRSQNKINCYSSVTGAQRDSSSGIFIG